MNEQSTGNYTPYGLQLMMTIMCIGTAIWPNKE